MPIWENTDDVRDYILLGVLIQGNQAPQGARTATYNLLSNAGKLWYKDDWTDDVAETLQEKLDAMTDAQLRAFWDEFPDKTDDPASFRPLNVLAARLGATEDGYHPDERAYVLNAPEYKLIGVGWAPEANAWLDLIVPAAPKKKKSSGGNWFSFGVIVTLVAVIALDRR